MKGIILAGGTGSRLYPLTKGTNKHLLPIGQFPMIYYPIYKLLQCEITDIVIVTGSNHIGNIVNLLGSGKELGLNLTYKVQDQPGGIAEAIGLVEDICKDEKMVVLLGDNIFEDSLVPYVHEFSKQNNCARILLKEIEDPHRYGIAEIDGNRIISIEEKPPNPKSNLSVTGIYMYDGQVFDIIREIQPSERGEMEITDVNNFYLRNGQLYYNILQGWWIDAGTFPSLRKASELVSQRSFTLEMERGLKPFIRNK